VHSKDAVIKINHYFTVWTKLKKLNREREKEKIIVLNKENEIRNKKSFKTSSVVEVMRLVWWHV